MSGTVHKNSQFSDHERPNRHHIHVHKKEKTQES